MPYIQYIFSLFSYSGIVNMCIHFVVSYYCCCMQIQLLLLLLLLPLLHFVQYKLWIFFFNFHVRKFEKRQTCYSQSNIKHTTRLVWWWKNIYKSDHWDGEKRVEKIRREKWRTLNRTMPPICPWCSGKCTDSCRSTRNGSMRCARHL